MGHAACRPCFQLSCCLKAVGTCGSTCKWATGTAHRRLCAPVHGVHERCLSVSPLEDKVLFWALVDAHALNNAHDIPSSLISQMKLEKDGRLFLFLLLLIIDISIGRAIPSWK